MGTPESNNIFEATGSIHALNSAFLFIDGGALILPSTYTAPTILTTRSIFFASSGFAIKTFARVV